MVKKESSKQGKNKTEDVIVFTTPVCPYCHKAKDFFKENGISYKEKDVASDKKAMEEMINASGEMGVPQIWVGNSIIVGYDKEQLKKALKL